MANITNIANCTYSILGVPLNATPATAILNVVENVLNFTKTFIPSVGKSGDTVQIKLTVSVPSSVLNPLTNVKIVDNLPSGLTFVTGSVKIDGSSQPSANPSSGIVIGNMSANDTKVVTFDATID